MKYYVLEHCGKMFLDLCGHYSIVSEARQASIWTDITYKSLWYFKHEIEATTGQQWRVLELDTDDIDYEVEVDEPAAARTFWMQLQFTIENCEKEITVEETTFDYSKSQIVRTWMITLIIDGNTRYIPVAECADGKYYRYKKSLSKPIIEDRMWKW